MIGRMAIEYEWRGELTSACGFTPTNAGLIEL